MESNKLLATAGTEENSFTGQKKNTITQCKSFPNSKQKIPKKSVQRDGLLNEPSLGLKTSDD